MSGTLLCVVLWAMPAQDQTNPNRAPADDFQADPSWKELGKNLWFVPKEKRLIVRARVSLREGFLEHLLCLEQSKEHESILATPAAPRLIHAGLLLTGAAVGHPVRYRPTFAPPAGSPVTIELEWKQDGKTLHANARDWVKDNKSGKTLAQDWVFAGSDLFQDPESKKMVYAADGGDLITVANFTSAILDVPFASTADDASRDYVANTERIPPRGTYVTMIMYPTPKAAPSAPAKAAPKP